MARKNADTNSDSRSERAVALILTLIAVVLWSRPSPSLKRLAEVVAEPGKYRDIRKQDLPKHRRTPLALLRALAGIRYPALESKGCGQIDARRHREHHSSTNQSRSRERHGGLTSARCRRIAARRPQSPPSPATTVEKPSSQAASVDRSGSVAPSPSPSRTGRT